MFGPLLSAKVEESLIQHLYLINCDALLKCSIDFSMMQSESEVSRRTIDGWCASYSNVILRDASRKTIGIGNIDYTINSLGEPLFWWEHLSILHEGEWQDILFYEYEFPIHIWAQLDETHKEQLKKMDVAPARACENVFNDSLMLLNETKPISLMN